MKNIITKKDQLTHKIAKFLFVLGLVALPAMTFAQTTQTQSLSDLVVLVIKYFNIAIVAIVGLAVLMFVWNVFQYFFKSDVADKKEAGLYVLYSVIGFFVIISFWGFVTILTNTFSLNTTAPSIQVFGSSVNSSSLFSGDSSNSALPSTSAGGGTSNSALPSTEAGSNGEANIGNGSD